MLNYLKSYGYFLGVYLILSFIFSLLYYFDILGTNVYNIIELITPIISIFMGSFILGKNSKEKGYLEGIKFVSIIIILMFVISYLAFDIGLNLKSLIYYLILFVTSTLASMIGINRKKQ